jgi:hypothetical protein
MADTIRIREDITLKHQSNLGEEIEDVDFSAGDELTILQEWDESWLAKNDAGQFFNIKKELAEQA